MVFKVFTSRLPRAIFLLPLVLAGVGCTPTVSPPLGGEDQTARLLEGMNECLAMQQAVDAKIAAQSEQLTTLQSRLSQPAPQGAAVATADKRENCKVVSSSDGKLLVGRMERVWLPNLKLLLPARVDTGAETSSIDARDIERFERNGERWVRFEIAHPESGEGIGLERKISRMVSIVQANQPEGERRPVILMEIAVGPVKQTAEFSLSDRSHLDYQVLIGRNILKDVMVVDVSKTNAAPPPAASKKNGKAKKAS